MVNKKSVVKSPVVKPTTEYIPQFPEIIIDKRTKIDLNWFAMSKKFKLYFKFLYRIKKPVETKEDFTELKNNLKELTALKEAWQEYCNIWDYYFNKEVK